MVILSYMVEKDKGGIPPATSPLKKPPKSDTMANMSATTALFNPNTPFPAFGIQFLYGSLPENRME
jgi:hypothetical protein